MDRGSRASDLGCHAPRYGWCLIGGCMDFKLLSLAEQVEYAEAQVQTAQALLDQAREDLRAAKIKAERDKFWAAVHSGRKSVSEYEAICGVNLTKEEKSLEMKRQEADDTIFYGVGGSESPNPELEDYADKHGQ